MGLPKNNSSEDLESGSSVFLLTSDLKKLKCNKVQLTSSPFLKKIIECIDDDDEFVYGDKDSYQNKQIQVIPIVYLDYHSREIERIIEFLNNDEIFFDSVRILYI